MRGIPDHIGQLRRGPVGWLGSSLNFRRRAAEKLVTLSVYETLFPAMADHSAMTLRGKTNQDQEAKEEQETGGEGASGHEGHLWLTEGPHISQHLPSFFFRQYERNKGSHRRALAAILQNPEQFPIGSSCLPLLVGEISR